ncbi:MAG: hypothetical protein R2911_31575 [Caldilineaceae bacterium]
MHELQLVLQERFRAIVLLFVIGGFLTTAAELIFMGHVNGSQLVGVYAAIFGAFIATHGMVAAPKTRYYLAGIFLLLCFMGVVGVLEHFGVRKTKEAMMLVQQMRAAMTEGAAALGGPNNIGANLLGRITSPPVLAPLSLSGFSFLGMFTLFLPNKPNGS